MQLTKQDVALRHHSKEYVYPRPFCFLFISYFLSSPSPFFMISIFQTEQVHITLQTKKPTIPFSKAWLLTEAFSRVCQVGWYSFSCPQAQHC